MQSSNLAKVLRNFSVYFEHTSTPGELRLEYFMQGYDVNALKVRTFRALNRGTAIVFWWLGFRGEMF